MPFFLDAGKGKCCMWLVRKVEISIVKIGFVDCKWSNSNAPGSYNPCCPSLLGSIVGYPFHCMQFATCSSYSVYVCYFQLVEILRCSLRVSSLLAVRRISWETYITTFNFLKSNHLVLTLFWSADRATCKILTSNKRDITCTNLIWNGYSNILVQVCLPSHHLCSWIFLRHYWREIQCVEFFEKHSWEGTKNFFHWFKTFHHII